MNDAEFQVRGLSEPRLAAHATSPLPAWLWSANGTRILWSNLTGAAVFGVASGAELAARYFGPIRTGARWRSSRAGCLSQARCGWTGYAALVLCPACSPPAAARDSTP